MIFSSPLFLFVFLPLVLIGYFAVQKRHRNVLLLLFSLLFYAWGEPVYVLIMLLTICIAYWAGIGLERYARYSDLISTLTILLIFSFLIYFKYTNFILQVYGDFTKINVKTLDIIMPIGISFYVFQTVSYIVDVYRGKVKAQSNFIKIALYITFFPQLIAGPIVKYHDIEQCLNKREDNLNNVVIGMKRFIIGLGKKVLIANTMGKIADDIFTIGASGIDVSIAWLGAVAYTFQIFFDFSGYSDMAIGLGRMFGFKILENFNYPYIANSISDFWHRWHISLSTWFKEYLYIPLGGNRHGELDMYRNLIIVFAATGIWHGANWTFLLWGLWHGLFLIIEKYLLQKKEILPIVFRYIYVMLVVVIGWVFFRSDSVNEAIKYIMVMFGHRGGDIIQFPLAYYLKNKVVLTLLLAIVCSTPLPEKLLTKINVCRFGNVLVNMFMVIILILSAVYVAGATYNPFIYFRF